MHLPPPRLLRHFSTAAARLAAGPAASTGPPIRRLRAGRHGDAAGSPTHSAADHLFPQPATLAPYIDTYAHLGRTAALLQLLEPGEDADPALRRFSRAPPRAARVDLLARAFFPPALRAVVDIHAADPTVWAARVDAALALTAWPRTLRYYFAAGVARTLAAGYSDEWHAHLEQAMAHPRCVAWGPIGLAGDYSPQETAPDAGVARGVFARQLRAAVARRKPVILQLRHDEGAGAARVEAEFLAVLRDALPADYPHVVLHAGWYSAGLLGAVLEGWPRLAVGISGAATFAGPNIDQVRLRKGVDSAITAAIKAGVLPLSRIVLESHSPYHTPRRLQPLGKPWARPCPYSHSGMVPIVAKYVAMWMRGQPGTGVMFGGVMEEEVNRVLSVTRENAEWLFGIDLLADEPPVADEQLASTMAEAAEPAAGRMPKEQLAGQKEPE